MPATVAPLRRVFEFNNQQLTDPDPNLSPDQVRQLYASHPGLEDLTNAMVGQPVHAADRLTYTFTARYGAKG